MAAIRRYLSLRQVAAAMGVNARWLYANRARLAAEHGFPRAALGMRYRWDEADIAAWQDRMRTATPPGNGNQPWQTYAVFPGFTPTDWAAELDRRASTL